MDFKTWIPHSKWVLSQRLRVVWDVTTPQDENMIESLTYRFQNDWIYRFENKSGNLDFLSKLHSHLWKVCENLIIKWVLIFLEFAFNKGSDICQLQWNFSSCRKFVPAVVTPSSQAYSRLFSDISRLSNTSIADSITAVWSERVRGLAWNGNAALSMSNVLRWTNTAESSRHDFRELTWNHIGSKMFMYKERVVGDNTSLGKNTPGSLRSQYCVTSEK